MHGLRIFLIVLSVVTIFLLSFKWDFLIEMGWPFGIQIGALVIGTLGSALGFLSDWEEKDVVSFFRVLAALAVTVVPVLLLISAYLDKKETQKDYTQLFDHVTGGSSFPYIGLSPDPRASSNRLKWFVVNCGTNPLYDLNVRIVDHARMLDVDHIDQVRGPDMDNVMEANTRRFAIGTLRSNGYERILHDYQGYLLTGNVWRLELTARNGHWRQWIGLTIQSNNWTVTNTLDDAYREFRKKIGLQ